MGWRAYFKQKGHFSAAVLLIFCCFTSVPVSSETDVLTEETILSPYPGQDSHPENLYLKENIHDGGKGLAHSTWQNMDSIFEPEAAPAAFFTTILKQDMPGLPIEKSIDIYVDNTITELNITITANVSTGHPNSVLRKPQGMVVPPIPGQMGPMFLADLGVGIRLIRITNPASGTWNLKKNEPAPWHVEVTAFSKIDFTTKFEQTINGVKQEIQGRPTSGEAVIITVSVPLIANIGSIDRILLTDHTGKFLNAANLQAGSGPAEFTGTIKFPKKPFQLTIAGKDSDGKLIQRLDTTKTISPVAVTLKVENVTHLYVDEDRTVSFTVSNEGDRSTVVTVDIQENQGFLQHYPEKNFTIPVGGKVTGSFKLHAGKTPGVTTTVILTEHALDVSGAKPHNETLVLTTERRPDNIPPVCNLTSVTGTCSLTQMDPCECHKNKWSALVTFGDKGYGLSKITCSIASPGVFTPDSFNPGDTIDNGAKTAKISGDCCEPMTDITVKDMANNTGQCKVDLTNGVTKPTYACTTTTTALTTLTTVTDPPPVFSSSDKTLPTCEVIQTNGQCTEQEMEPGVCGDHVWYGTVQVRDEGAGLYTLKSTVEDQASLIHDPFKQGDTTMKKAKLVTTCCNALSYVVVVDMAGNSASCELDVRIKPEMQTKLSPGAIAGVSVGVIAAFVGTVLAAVFITKYAKCCVSSTSPTSNTGQTGRFRTTAWD